MTNEESKMVDFTVNRETINEYTLEDGNILRLRLVLAKVTATGRKTPQGDPEYILNSQVVATVITKKDFKIRPVL